MLPAHINTQDKFFVEPGHLGRIYIPSDEDSPPHDDRMDIFDKELGPEDIMHVVLSDTSPPPSPSGMGSSDSDSACLDSDVPPPMIVFTPNSDDTANDMYTDRESIPMTVVIPNSDVPPPMTVLTPDSEGDDIDTDSDTESIPMTVVIPDSDDMNTTGPSLRELQYNEGESGEEEQRVRVGAGASSSGQNFLPQQYTPASFAHFRDEWLE